MIKYFFSMLKQLFEESNFFNKVFSEWKIKRINWKLIKICRAFLIEKLSIPLNWNDSFWLDLWTNFNYLPPLKLKNIYCDHSVVSLSIKCLQIRKLENYYFYVRLGFKFYYYFSVQYVVGNYSLNYKTSFYWNFLKYIFRKFI